MRAVVISIGDELVLGQTQDTNGTWLSARLAERGIRTDRRKVVADDRAAIVKCVIESAGESELLILSGGLGPTPDDMTRQALAEVMGVSLKLHQPSLERMESRFRARETAMPESCRSQAMVPDGAGILENSCGTAPGFKIRLDGAAVFAVPGVPSEMRAMFVESIAPSLDSMSSAGCERHRFIRTLKINTFGCGESAVAGMLGGLMDEGRHPRVGTTVSDGIVSVRICSDCESMQKAVRELEKTGRAIRKRLGTFVFGEGEETLQSAIGDLLLKARKTVVTAESCTAGLVGKLLTDPAGASAWFLGGWIVYADRMKHEELGVSVDMLNRHGAVSEQVAGCMAEQALTRSDADYSVALTGIAGPEGAAPGKAVGTVWIAVGKRLGRDIEVQPKRFLFQGNRECIRDRSSKTALNMLRLELLRNPGRV